MASKHISKLIVVTVLFFSAQLTFGQIGINTVNPDTSAALDVQGTNKGVLFPRTTQLQLSNIFQPATGLTLFQTDFFPGLYYNLGSTTIPNWLSVGMYHNGNDLFWDKGNVGVGLSSPLVEFHIKGNGTMFRLEAGVGENAFMEFYANGPSSRSGYLGYITNGGPNLSIANARTNGDIDFTTTGTGKLTTNRSMSIGADLIVTNNITSAYVNTSNLYTINLGVSSLLRVTGTAIVTGNATVTDVLTVNNDITVTDHVTAARVTTTGNVNAAGSIQEGGNALLPAGVIVMWSGTTAPAGWALCNGSGGTPDLRGRFVVGYDPALSAYNQIGDAGGAGFVQITTANMPSHTHGSGTLVNSPENRHRHSTAITSGEGIGTQGRLSSVDSRHGTSTKYSSYANAHTHSISGSTASAGSGGYLENRPPYYTVAYIIKL
ncbi:MAG: microcystin-dependent protein [Vicingaceae bacterium]|jgi:microcystin-dependent protein